ncbi:hypothetical protein CVT24_004988 [Panaeolus cyanescens]|uniref:Uncharacterized protein n=1 Tax=Panaeolus cyanescens TaxID=181874 RepID=A0A409V9N6_9AGAR|nr:hypothetical protein CVT24_004988 [Panaeolus cyanescens]
MAPNSAILKYLDLPSDAEDEDTSTALTALLTSAVHDDAPTQTLSDIYNRVIADSGKDYLDPLHLIPLLVPSSDNSAGDVLALIGECGSPKEVIIAVEEALERLRHELEVEEDEDMGPHKASLSAQLGTLLDLYGSAIPRLKLRRKSALETIRPFIQELEGAIKLVAVQANRETALSLLTSISRLSNKFVIWLNSINLNGDEDLNNCKAIIETLLDRTLIAFSNSIQSQIAQRTLEKRFPRQTVPSSDRYNWQPGEESVRTILESYKLLGNAPSKTVPSSTKDLFFFAYETPGGYQPLETLRRLMPVILSGLKTDTFVDESLTSLLKIFHDFQNHPENPTLPPEFTTGLGSVLPSIASPHPDPHVRNQVFRCLSLVLSVADPHNRFQQLIELSRDSEYPQMRVASVGLVKEALLRAISDPSKGDKYFLKPLFLSSFGPILFRFNPPDLLSTDISLQDFVESSESSRILECLSLYYVLIHRDRNNLTGIRDSDVKQTIDRNLLRPLKSAIIRWSENTSKGHTHEIGPIASLQISIDRIEKAHTELF